MKISIHKLALLTVVTTLLCACHQTSSQSPYRTAMLGDQELFLEIANTPELRQRGLMFRKSLPEKYGMLFFLEQPGPTSFWMQNTEIPLDIAYINSNFIIEEIHQLQPFNTQSVHSRSHQILYALEVNQGYFKKHKITPGMKLHLLPKNKP